jgi:hypothetical protein
MQHNQWRRPGTLPISFFLYIPEDLLHTREGAPVVVPRHKCTIHSDFLYTPTIDKLIETLHYSRMKFLNWLLPFLSLTSSCPPQPSQRPTAVVRFPLYRLSSYNTPSSSGNENKDSMSFSSLSSECHSHGGTFYLSFWLP